MMLKKIVLSLFALMTLVAVPAMACNQLDDQVWDCPAPVEKVTEKVVTLADITGQPQAVTEPQSNPVVPPSPAWAPLQDTGISAILAGSVGGGLSCSCDECCRHPDTNRCIRCPRPPATTPETTNTLMTAR